MSTTASRTGRPARKGRPAWDVPLRILLAALGGYGLTSLATALLARLLPGSPLDASLSATMMSFAIATALVVWIFAAHSALRVTGWILGLMAVTGGLVWLMMPGGAAS